MAAIAILAAGVDTTAPRTFFDGYMTFAGAALMITMIASCYAILRAIRTTRRENEADIRAQIDPVKGDVRAILATIADFMPRSEIESRDADVRKIAEAADHAISDLREKYARLDERQQSLAGDMSEIKNLMKEQARDTFARLDKMNDCLTAISRKVG